MKKRNLKSFDLNKKTISTFETSKVNAGSMVTLGACTYYIYTIGVTVQQAVDYLLEDNY